MVLVRTTIADPLLKLACPPPALLPPSPNTLNSATFRPAGVVLPAIDVRRSSKRELVPRHAGRASCVVLDQPVLNVCATRRPIVIEYELLPAQARRVWGTGAGSAREEVRVELERISVSDGWSRVANLSTLARYAGDAVERASRCRYEPGRHLGRNVVVVTHGERPGPVPRRLRIGRRPRARNLPPRQLRIDGLEATLPRRRDLRYFRSPVLLTRRRWRRPGGTGPVGCAGGGQEDGHQGHDAEYSVRLFLPIQLHGHPPK